MAARDSETIKVHVRVRPLSDHERARGDQECIHIADDCRTVRFVVPTASGASRSTIAPTVRALAFDSALANASQAQIFESAGTMSLLQDALAGCPVTIFAYGQTGSGKTYTMTGPESLDFSEQDAPPPTADGPYGLIPRGVGALFSLITAMEDAGQLPGGCSVRASYLELYNESLNDLLNTDSTNLQLRSTPSSGTFVENLVQVECESVADAMLVFAEGTRNRKVGSHNLNKDSSRSHCMMTLHLQRRDALGAGGKICFCDLAGSEGLSESLSKGDAAKETGHINKSLFTLGNVISALADSRKRGGYIPYRDSKLTRLLQDSLSGEGRTLMLACCSPSSHHLEETANTLNFASRTKNIQTRPVAPSSEAGGASMLLQMQQQIRALQEENASLRTRLTQQPPQPPPRADGSSGVSVSGKASGGSGDVQCERDMAGGKPNRPGIGVLRAVERAADSTETEALRREVASLREANDELRQAHETVTRENRMLAAKLERLELVFENG